MLPGERRIHQKRKGVLLHGKRRIQQGRSDRRLGYGTGGFSADAADSEGAFESAAPTDAVASPFSRSGAGPNT